MGNHPFTKDYRAVIDGQICFKEQLKQLNNRDDKLPSDLQQLNIQQVRTLVVAPITLEPFCAYRHILNYSNYAIVSPGGQTQKKKDFEITSI